MKPIFFVFTALISGLITQAEAATFKVSFFGEVTSVRTDVFASKPVNIGSLGAIYQGMFFDGSFTLNTSAVGVPSSFDPNATEYYQNTVVSDLTYDFDGTILSFPAHGFARVTNTPSTGAGSDEVDRIEIRASGARDDVYEGLELDRALFALQSRDKTILTSGSLPSIPEWDALFADSDFTDESNTIQLERIPFVSPSDAKDVYISYLVLDVSVSEIAEPIPLPAGAPLLLAGLGVFAALRRKAP